MKTALITGGTKGIGLEAVVRFVRQGYQVVTCARHSDTWRQATLIHPELESVRFIPTDISVQVQVEHLFDCIKSDYSGLDVAVNNASPALGSRGLYHTVDPDALQETLQQDFWSHALCLRYQLELMNSGSAIVNISSINGLRPTPNAAMYAATKHALEGLTRSLALENIERGIRINAVAPGVTWTPRWEERAKEIPAIRQDVSSVVPLGRFASSKEIVDAIEFLCSDKASYIVGHTLVVDGGLSIK